MNEQLQLRAFTLLGVFFVFTSCRTAQISQQDSPLSQVTTIPFKCESGGPKRTKNILERGGKALLESSNSSQYPWTEAQKERIASYLAVLPNAYTDHLIESASKSGFAIYQTNIGFQGGLTSLAYYPEFSRFAPSMGESMIDQIFLHEIGHAMQVFIETEQAKKLGKTEQSIESELDAAFREASGSNVVASYPRTNSAEFFAESFQSFYCSEEARAYVKKNLPVTYAFLDKYLDSPVWTDDESLVPPKNDNGSQPQTPSQPDSIYTGAIRVLTRATPQNSNQIQLVISTPKANDDLVVCVGDWSDCNDAGKRLDITKLSTPMASTVNMYLVNRPFDNSSLPSNLSLISGISRSVKPDIRKISLQVKS